MELKHVKQVFVKEGEAKRILHGDMVLWEKSGIHITRSATKPLTDFLAGKYAELMFEAKYGDTDSIPVWSVSGLPEGLEAEVSSAGLKISGYVAEAGTHEITVTVTLGEYTDSQTYVLDVESDGYGIEITTSNENNITDFELNKYASKTFEANFNIPEAEQDCEEVWHFRGLPSELTASGATVSGTATSLITTGVVTSVTKGSYRASKNFSFEICGLKISTTKLPSGKVGDSYSATLEVTQKLPLETTGSVTYYASNLPAGLSFNSSTGVISGTPTAAGTTDVSVYAVQGAYTSPTKSLSLSIAAQPPQFKIPESVMNLNPDACTTKNNIGYSVGTLSINGNGFSTHSFALRHTALVNVNGETQTTTSQGDLDVIVNGNQADNNIRVPSLTISVNVVNDNQLTLNFVLKKRSTATAAVLRSRTTEVVDVIMYKGNINNVIGTHTVGIRFI